MQDKALGALQTDSPFQSITRNAAGGFDVDQPGAKDAALARSTLAKGDVERALGVNAADRDFAFTLPDMASASNVVASENRRNQAQLQEGLSKIIKARQRTGEGVQVPGGQFEGATAQAIADYVKSKPMGGEVAAMELYNKSRMADIALKDAIKASLRGQYPAPGYVPGTGAGNVAAQAMAQMPLPSTPVDLSSAVPFYGISDAVNQYTAQARQRETDDLLREIYSNRLGTGFGDVA